MTIRAGDDALLARARTLGVEVRQLDFARLVLVAQLEADNVAVVRGYKTTARMLEDFWLIGPAEAKRIVTHARLLCGDTTLSGEPLPPTLPATAQAARDGELDEARVAVIATFVEVISRIPGIGPDEVAKAEQSLAAQARRVPARGLVRVAQRLVEILDPDGVAPDDDPEPGDEVSAAAAGWGVAVLRVAVGCGGGVGGGGVRRPVRPGRAR